MLRHACARGLRQLARRAAAAPHGALPPPHWTPSPALRAFAAAADEGGSPAVRALLANAKPAPLHNPAEAGAAASPGDDGGGFFRRLMLRLGGFYSAESTRMRAALRLRTAILDQMDDDELLRALGLPLGDFRCRFAVASLHLWLTLVRLRAEGDEGKRLGQELYDHFWADMENRVRDEGVVVRLSKWMRELEQTFYGSSAAYDAALSSDAAGDALRSALRRNIFLGEGLPADAARAARYVRHQLACLALTPSEAVMAGNLRFSLAPRK